MPHIDLEPGTLAVLRKIAGEKADGYIGEILLPALQNATKAPSASIKDIRAAFSNPYRCLQAFFLHYAFSRRGKDRDELAYMANLALKRTASEENFEELLQQEDGSAVWHAFEEICAEKRRKSSEQLNRGLIAGMVELAQEIYRIDRVGSISNWVVRGILQTDRVEPQFLRIVDIRGVGPKTTSTFLRDIVFLYDLEDQLDNADRLYIQPIDRWLRVISGQILPEIEEGTVDWILAGKIAKYSRKAGVSGVRYNMGCTYYGSREVKEHGRLKQALFDLIS